MVLSGESNIVDSPRDRAKKRWEKVDDRAPEDLNRWPLHGDA